MFQKAVCGKQSSEENFGDAMKLLLPDKEADEVTHLFEALANSADNETEAQAIVSWGKSAHAIIVIYLFCKI